MTNGRRRRSGSDEDGIALVAVLWIVVLLAVIAVAVMSMTHMEHRAARNLASQALAEATCDAAIYRAIADLFEPPAHRRWRVDGTPASLAFDGKTVLVAIQDELGRIDLNNASEELLDGLLRSVGVPSGPARALLDAIADWRDEDDDRRINGAEATDYRDTGRSYVPRNGWFQTVEELRLVLGMTDDLFARLEPALTVYSQNRGIDVESAPRAALAALPGMNEAAVSERLRLRAERAASAGDQPGAANSLGQNLAGRAYAIRAIAALDDGTRLIREAVVRLTFNPSRPFVVHAWRTRTTD